MQAGEEPSASAAPAQAELSTAHEDDEDFDLATANDWERIQSGLRERRAPAGAADDVDEDEDMDPLYTQRWVVPAEQHAP